ncbi:hypothetical protein NOR_07738 [Metarhizium rileyi]|uniref:Uncharacterized protein n=1 Tax=Metarhizium rileyi (strain RCEF 4871) TaxID=1649241 RepID=A0A166XL44_METRR|nr:hypothetical protein NOR_07738 [Metarhizium rileyi RCEF 4871]
MSTNEETMEKEREHDQQNQASESENDNHEDDDSGPRLSNESTAEEEQQEQPARPDTKTAPKKRKRPRNDPWQDEGRRKQMVPRQQQQQQPMQQPMQQQMPQQQMMAAPKDEKKNPLKLRLDLNLDVEIELRAKIHGDVTLALLDMGYIDGIIDEEYDAFDAVWQAFLAVMDEENRSIWTEHDINITSTMTDAWESTGVWFWACVRSINAWLFVFGDHILPKFSADRALVVNLKQVSTFWHENVDQDVKAKVDDEHRYQAELRSFIDKEP